MTGAFSGLCFPFKKLSIFYWGYNLRADMPDTTRQKSRQMREKTQAADPKGAQLH